MAHDFNTDLKYEQSERERQNRFYRDVLGASEIKRYDFDDPNEKDYQKRDIDLKLFFNDGREPIAISEKSRRSRYNDILLEVYSKYPNEPGWTAKGEADLVAYFMPGKAYIMREDELKNFCKTHIKGKLFKKDFDLRHYGKTSPSVPTSIEINGKKEKLYLVQSYNHPDDSDDEWFTEGLAVSFDCLRRCGVKVDEYDFN